MNGFNDIYCSRCGHRYGWFGFLSKPIPCPECGYDNLNSCKELDVKICEARARVLKDLNIQGTLTGRISHSKPNLEDRDGSRNRI